MPHNELPLTAAEIAENLEYELIRTGKSLNELAKKAGLMLSEISRVLSGTGERFKKESVRIEFFKTNVDKLSKALACSPGNLLKRKPPSKFSQTVTSATDHENLKTEFSDLKKKSSPRYVYVFSDGVVDDYINGKTNKLPNRYLRMLQNLKGKPLSFAGVYTKTEIMDGFVKKGLKKHTPFVLAHIERIILEDNIPLSGLLSGDSALLEKARALYSGDLAFLPAEDLNKLSLKLKMPAKKLASTMPKPFLHSDVAVTLIDILKKRNISLGMLAQMTKISHKELYTSLYLKPQRPPVEWVEKILKKLQIKLSAFAAQVAEAGKIATMAPAPKPFLAEVAPWYTEYRSNLVYRKNVHLHIARHIDYFVTTPSMLGNDIGGACRGAFKYIELDQLYKEHPGKILSENVIKHFAEHVKKSPMDLISSVSKEIKRTPRQKAIVKILRITEITGRSISQRLACSYDDWFLDLVNNPAKPPTEVEIIDITKQLKTDRYKLDKLTEIYMRADKVKTEPVAKSAGAAATADNLAEGSQWTKDANKIRAKLKADSALKLVLDPKSMTERELTDFSYNKLNRAGVIEHKQISAIIQWRGDTWESVIKKSASVDPNYTKILRQFQNKEIAELPQFLKTKMASALDVQVKQLQSLRLPVVLDKYQHYFLRADAIEHVKKHGIKSLVNSRLQLKQVQSYLVGEHKLTPRQNLFLISKLRKTLEQVRSAPYDWYGRLSASKSAQFAFDTNLTFHIYESDLTLKQFETKAGIKANEIKRVFHSPQLLHSFESSFASMEELGVHPNRMTSSFKISSQGIKFLQALQSGVMRNGVKLFVGLFVAGTALAAAAPVIAADIVSKKLDEDLQKRRGPWVDNYEQLPTVDVLRRMKDSDASVVLGGIRMFFEPMAQLLFGGAVRSRSLAPIQRLANMPRDSVMAAWDAYTTLFNRVVYTDIPAVWYTHEEVFQRGIRAFNDLRHGNDYNRRDLIAPLQALILPRHLAHDFIRTNALPLSQTISEVVNKVNWRALPADVVNAIRDGLHVFGNFISESVSQFSLISNAQAHNDMGLYIEQPRQRMQPVLFNREEPRERQPVELRLAANLGRLTEDNEPLAIETVFLTQQLEALQQVRTAFMQVVLSNQYQLSGEQQFVQMQLEDFTLNIGELTHLIQQPQIQPRQPLLVLLPELGPENRVALLPPHSFLPTAEPLHAEVPHMTGLPATQFEIGETPDSHQFLNRPSSEEIEQEILDLLSGKSRSESTAAGGVAPRDVAANTWTDESANVTASAAEAEATTLEIYHGKRTMSLNLGEAGAPAFVPIPPQTPAWKQKQKESDEQQTELPAAAEEVDEFIPIPPTPPAWKREGRMPPEPSTWDNLLDTAKELIQAGLDAVIPSAAAADDVGALLQIMERQSMSLLAVTGMNEHPTPIPSPVPLWKREGTAPTTPAISEFPVPIPLPVPLWKREGTAPTTPAISEFPVPIPPPVPQRKRQSTVLPTVEPRSIVPIPLPVPQWKRDGRTPYSSTSPALTPIASTPSLLTRKPSSSVTTSQVGQLLSNFNTLASRLSYDMFTAPVHSLSSPFFSASLSGQYNSFLPPVSQGLTILSQLMQTNLGAPSFSSSNVGFQSFSSQVNDTSFTRWANSLSRYGNSFSCGRYKDRMYTDSEIEQRVRDAVLSRYYWGGSWAGAYEDAVYSLMNPAEFSFSAFASIVQRTGLVSSYNSVNIRGKIPHLRGYRRFIGGVSGKVSLIESLLNSPYTVMEKFPVFFIDAPGNRLPFPPTALWQIGSEIRDTTYIYNTNPFYSLHPNKAGGMYPVIHPALKNTLVGEVIAFLDYFMKGFLNGGVFSKSFLMQWHKTANLDRKYLREHLIDLKKYCKKHMKGFSYTSLREQMYKLGVEIPLDEIDIDGDENSVYKTKFRTSFRIIAKQDGIYQQGNVFYIKPDFDVEYTIEPMPDYQEHLNQHFQKHGCYPQSYQKLGIVYAQAAKIIKEKMPQIPLFTEYFKMLGIINFFCYYFHTLKANGQYPVLPAKTPAYNQQCPKLFPPLPVRYFLYHRLKITYANIIENLSKEHRDQFDRLFQSALDTEELIFPNELRQAILKTVEQLIAAQLPGNLAANTAEFILDIAPGFIKQFQRGLRIRVADLKQKNYSQFKSVLEKINHSILEQEIAAKPISIEEIDAMPTMAEQFTAMRTIIENYSEQRRLGKNRKTRLKELEHERKKTIEAEIEIHKPEIERFLINNGVEKDEKKRKQVYDAAITNDIEPQINKLVEEKKKIIENVYQSDLQNLKIAESKELEDNENNKQSILSEMKENKGKLNHAVEGLLASDVVQKYNAISRYTSSTLDIADEGYYQELGENFKIVGGCGMRLPNLSAQRLPQGEAIAAKMLTALSAKGSHPFELMTHEGKHYAAFSLPTKSLKKRYHPLDHREDLLPVKKEVSSKQTTKVESIHSAAMGGKLDALNTLLTKNSELANAQTTMGESPLLLACMHGQLAAVQILLAHGADVNYQTPNGFFALFMAIQRNHTDIVLHLLRNASQLNVNIVLDDGSTALHMAIELGHSQVAEALVKSGADITLKRKTDGFMALHAAASKGDVGVARAIVDTKKFDINTPYESNKTAMHLAAAHGHLAFVCYLVTVKANPNIQSTEGDTPLMLALYQGHNDTAHELTLCSSINIKNQEGETALLIAFSFFHLFQRRYLSRIVLFLVCVFQSLLR